MPDRAALPMGKDQLYPGLAHRGFARALRHGAVARVFGVKDRGLAACGKTDAAIAIVFAGLQAHRFKIARKVLRSPRHINAECDWRLEHRGCSGTAQP